MLLSSSPPKGTDLCQLKNQVESVVSESNLETPIQSYLKRSSDLLEKVVTENALLYYSNQEKDSLLNTCRTRKRSKQVALKGKHVLSIAKVLKLVETTKKKASKKKRSKDYRKHTPIPESSKEKDETSDDELLGV
jgi:hypothetical protein